jgi:hypothetical protein
MFSREFCAIRILDITEFRIGYTRTSGTDCAFGAHVKTDQCTIVRYWQNLQLAGNRAESHRIAPVRNIPQSISGNFATQLGILTRNCLATMHRFCTDAGWSVPSASQPAGSVSVERQ